MRATLIAKQLKSFLLNGVEPQSVSDGILGMPIYYLFDPKPEEHCNLFFTRESNLERSRPALLRAFDRVVDIRIPVGSLMVVAVVAEVACGGGHGGSARRPRIHSNSSMQRALLIRSKSMIDRMH